MKFLGVIPARLSSTRLPRKVLREVAGEPLLVWVYRAAKVCSALRDVVIAVDHEEVAALCREREMPFVMTSPNLPSGTDRLFAVSLEREADVYVNIQGDEPLITPAHIDALVAPFAKANVDVSTLKVPCPAEDVNNPNVVKVVSATDGRALYFSRATIPYDRDATGNARVWKHLGLYAYRKAALERFASLATGELEQVEKLEQLRLLENNIALYVSEAPCDTVGVDTEEDLQRVEELLKARQ